MLKLKCIRASIGTKRYPTRPSYNGVYNPNNYFINTGDVMNIIDMKIDGNDVVCQIGGCFTNGIPTSVLNGRWFVYDGAYFE